MQPKLLLLLVALASAFDQRPPVDLSDRILRKSPADEIITITFGSCYGIQDRRSDIFNLVG